VYDETGIGLTGYVKEVTENECAYEASVGDQYENVSKQGLTKLFVVLDEKLKKLMEK
jgi:hypothetical protein